MKLSTFLTRLISGDKVIEGGAMTLRNVIVWLFIALVATCFTHPEPHSLYDKPLPLPPELGLGN